MNELETNKVAETWIKLHHLPEDSPEREEHFWAYIKLSELCDSEPEICWHVINKIRQLDGSEAILSNLAAGPLEDLLAKHGASFIARIEILAEEDLQFKKLLGAVWQRDMPESIWSRIKAVAAPSW